MMSEAALEYDPGAGTGPFHVILRISRTADRDGVRPIVLIKKVLDRKIKREVPRRLVLGSSGADQVEPSCRCRSSDCPCSPSPWIHFALSARAFYRAAERRPSS